MFSQAILDVMVNLQFTLVETLWKTFWRFSQSQAGDATLAVWVIYSWRQMLFQEAGFIPVAAVILFPHKLCVSAVTMSQRSVSQSPAWCCCASMTQCCAGAVTVTTACTRAWWKSSSLMSSDPSPVSLYRNDYHVTKHHHFPTKILPTSDLIYNTFVTNWN